jgi:nucleoside-diphosphate-sugar epimerase
MNKVLITGATGFIGRFALEPLQKLGFEVHAVTSRAVPNARGDGVIWHRADLLQRQEVARLTSEVKASHLLHLAWYVEHGKFWDAPENELWLEASKHLFERFVADGGKRIVAAGTCAEYDWKTDGSPFSEDSSPIAPASQYGSAKTDLHRYLAALSDRADITYAWGRIFYVFGPGESGDRFVPMVIKTLLADETFVCTSPADVKDFMYVRDVAAAFAQMLASKVTGGINVASGTGTRLDMLAEQIRALCGSGAMSPNSDASITGTALVGANDRLLNEIGFSNRTDIQQALRETISCWGKKPTDSEGVRNDCRSVYLPQL